MSISFRPLLPADIPALTPIMTRSFDHDSLVHTGKPHGGPPGYDDGSFLAAWALHPASTAFCISVDGTLAGAAVLWINEDQINRLGCIFLDPDLMGRGLGRQAWMMIEKMFPKTRVWLTDTPLRSTGNLVYYINKCGFQMIHIEFPDDLPGGSAVLRKDME